MHTKTTSLIAIAALALTACGGDDDGGGGAPQDDVADMMIEALNESFSGDDMAGVTIDEDCIRDAVGEIPADDARAIVAAGPDGNPEVSDETENIGEAMFACVDIDLSQIDTGG